MKKRKKRKPKIADKKQRGEWAEMHFMVRATDHDLPVSKPWGDSRSFDFVVGWPGRFVAVQVKSTTLEVENGGYACSVCTSGKPYAPGSFDFLAAYVIYDDAWYIIPAKEFLGQAWVGRGLSSVGKVQVCEVSRGVASARSRSRARLHR